MSHIESEIKKKVESDRINGLVYNKFLEIFNRFYFEPQTAKYSESVQKALEEIGEAAAKNSTILYLVLFAITQLKNGALIVGVYPQLKDKGETFAALPTSKINLYVSLDSAPSTDLSHSIALTFVHELFHALLFAIRIRNPDAYKDIVQDNENVLNTELDVLMDELYEQSSRISHGIDKSLYKALVIVQSGNPGMYESDEMDEEFFCLMAEVLLQASLKIENQVFLQKNLIDIHKRFGLAIQQTRNILRPKNSSNSLSLSQLTGSSSISSSTSTASSSYSGSSSSSTSITSSSYSSFSHSPTYIASPMQSDTSPSSTSTEKMNP